MTKELSQRIIYELLSKFDDLQVLRDDWETCFDYLQFEDISNSIDEMISEEYDVRRYKCLFI